MKINTIAVIGAGTMGNGIAHVSATAGLDVILVDVKQDFLDRAIKIITKNCDRMVKKEKITEDDKNTLIGKIKTTTNLNDVAEADLIVEAAIEAEDLKLSLFKSLDEISKEGTIIASNTSSISISKLASATNRPELVIGMHFMNPVPMMKLVEIVKGLKTAQETIVTVVELAKSLGKTPVLVNDYPGFVANRILLPMINEAVYCLMEGIADPES
nr:3-hydroxybutyryl-CoA dehydrogenase [bacterium]